MMFHLKNKHRVRRFFIVVFTMVLLCSVLFSIPVSAYNPSPVEREDTWNGVIPLGQSSYDNYRGVEYLGGSLRPVNADLYYAPGQSLVRHNVTYPFFDFNGADERIWIDELVEAGYSFDFYRYDAEQQALGFDLPIATGIKFAFSCYLSNISETPNADEPDYTLFLTRVNSCDITVRYYLYKGSGDDINLNLVPYTTTKSLTPNQITNYMKKSDKFRQNYQSDVFDYNFEVDFGRPVLIQGIDVHFVFSLHSDSSRKNDIEDKSSIVWYQIEKALNYGSGTMYNALRQTGFICDYSFPRLINYFYNETQMRDDFIALGTNQNYSLWLSDSYISMDDLKPLTLTSAIVYAGNSLKVFSELLVRIISLDFVNALLGAVLTLSVVSAFIGVAVYYGRKKE